MEKNLKKSNFEKFIEIENLIDKFELFDIYFLKNNVPIKNQLFSYNPPPFDLVKKILYILINKELNETIYYEFSKKNLAAKK